MPLKNVADQLKTKLRRRASTVSRQPQVPEASSSRRSSPHPDSSKRKPKKTYPPSADTLLDGIGEYIFINQLGHGKFSKVLLAQHYKTGEKYAVKVIDKRVHEYRVMSRLVREVYLMQIMDHVNIVRLYETYETADSLFLVMEYVPGTNLDEHLRRGPLSEPEARLIFRQMVAAVDYCHQHWIVHRDLKAPNVLLTPDGQVRLADFGLGNRFGLQRLKTICGSLLYYSPEIFTGQKYVGPEVDCWCLGVSLFRMTAGFEPFSHARTVGELKNDVLNGNYPMPEQLSPALQDTIRKCLAMDRRKRMGLRQALKGDAWLNDNGRLKDIFADEEEERCKYEREQARRRCLKDMEDEVVRGSNVKKTIMYHPVNASIYFTSYAGIQHTGYPKREQVVSAQEALQKQLIKTVHARLRDVQLLPLPSSKDAQSPIHRLLRKFKAPIADRKRLKKSSSTLSLSQLYQRVAQDQITYYTLHIQPTSSYCNRRESIASSLSSTQDMYAEQRELISLVRSTCELLGITYRHESDLRLVCVMTLRNFTPVMDHPPSSQQRKGSLFTNFRNANSGHSTANVSTPVLNNKRTAGVTTLSLDGTPSSFLSSGNSNEKWSRLVKKLSTAFSSNQNLPLSQSLHFQSSAHLSNNPSARQIPQKMILDPNEQEKDNTTMFMIQVFAVDRSDDSALGLQFSKLEGSAKVFKYAKGWITGVLAYNTIAGSA